MKRSGTPLNSLSSWTTFSKAMVERGAVGIPYFSSSVRQHPATAVTQPGQPATPKITASPFSLISFHKSVVSSLNMNPVLRFRMVFTVGMFSANHA